MCFWPFFLTCELISLVYLGISFSLMLPTKYRFLTSVRWYSLAVRSPRFFQPTTMYLWPSDEVFVVPNKVLVSDIRLTITLWLSIVLGLLYCVLSVAFWHSTCSYWVLTLPVFWMWSPLTEGEFTSYWKRKGTGWHQSEFCSDVLWLLCRCVLLNFNTVIISQDFTSVKGA